MNPVTELLKMAKDKIKEEPEKYPRLLEKINECIAMVRDAKSHYIRRGDDIQSRRKELGLTLRDIERHTGISYETVRLHEKNHFNLTLESISTHNRILNYLEDKVNEKGLTNDKK